MRDKEMMLALPEVAHLVEKIPIARLAIRPTSVQLRFFQVASETKMPLRKQCEFLGIPWHARKVPIELVSKDVLRVARLLDEQTFGQTMPTAAEEMANWCKAVINGIDGELPDHAMKWLAYHGAEIGDTKPAIFSYLKHASLPIPPSTSVAVVIKRAEKREEHHARHHPMLVNIGAFARDGGFLMPGDVRDAFARLAAATAVVHFDLAEPDRSRLDYPSTVTDPFVDGGLSIHVLVKREDFRAAGRELKNCISDRDTSDFLGRRAERNYFRHACGTNHKFAVIRWAGKAIAAASYDEVGKLYEAKAASNKDLLDVDVLRFAWEFSKHLARGGAPMPGEDAANPQPVAVGEWQDSADRLPRPDTWAQIRRLFIRGGA